MSWARCLAITLTSVCYSVSAIGQNATSTSTAESNESKLIEQGIVSSLDYKRSLLNVAQLTERVSIEQQRLAQLKEMHLQRSKIQQELLSQFELNYQVEQHAFDQLQITAGIDGMLQELNVELGQNLVPGTRLAVVGSNKALKAELSVKQADAEKVALNMAAKVNTFSQADHSEVDAKVDEAWWVSQRALVRTCIMSTDP